MARPATLKTRGRLCCASTAPKRNARAEWGFTRVTSNRDKVDDEHQRPDNFEEEFAQARAAAAGTATGSTGALYQDSIAADGLVRLLLRFPMPGLAGHIIESARGAMREWRRHYNAERLHGSLGHKTPEEFALAAKSQLAS